MAAGVGTILADLPAVLMSLTLVGAAYLFYLGLVAFISPPATNDGREAHEGWYSWLWRGFTISAVNPKGLLLFLALLPQFTSSEGWPVALQIMVLGSFHALNCLLVYSAVSFGSRSVLRSRPAFASVVGRVAGSAMITIAVLLILEQVSSLALFA